MENVCFVIVIVLNNCIVSEPWAWFFLIAVMTCESDIEMKINDVLETELHPFFNLLFQISSMSLSAMKSKVFFLILQKAF